MKYIYIITGIFWIIAAFIYGFGFVSAPPIVVSILCIIAALSTFILLLERITN